MTSQGMIRTLNEVGLLRDDTYQQLKADLKRGYSRSSSAILEGMASDARQRWGAERGGYLPVQSIKGQSSTVDDSTDIDHSIDIDVDNLDQLRYLIEQINTVETASADNLNQLQSLLEQLSVEQSFNANNLKNQLHHLLEQLNTIGLLTERIYYQLKPKIDSGAINSELLLYRQAASWMELEEALSPEIVAPRLAKLNAVGILSDVKQTELLEALRQGELKHPIEFFNYFDKALVLNLRNYTNQPEDYFTEGYKAVADMLQAEGLLEHSVGDFQVQFEVNKTSRSLMEGIRRIAQTEEYEALPDIYRRRLERTSLYYDAVVSVQANGRTYQRRNSYSPPKKDQDFRYKINADKLAQLFDKVLMDQGSPYRIYGISSSYSTGGIFDYSVNKTFGNPAELSNQIAFLALTDDQAQTYFYEGIEGEYPPTLYSSDRIDEILTLFEQIDLLDHLSQEQIEASQKKIAEGYITQPYEIFSIFDDLILEASWESDSDSPYRDLTQRFAHISHGHFIPVDISNEFSREDETAAQTFTINETQYQTTLEYRDKWLDRAFFGFIQSVAEQEISIGKFYPVYLDYGDDATGYMFLLPVQFEALTAQNLIRTEPAQSL